MTQQCGKLVCNNRLSNIVCRGVCRAFETPDVTTHRHASYARLKPDRQHVVEKLLHEAIVRTDLAKAVCCSFVKMALIGKHRILTSFFLFTSVRTYSLQSVFIIHGTISTYYLLSSASVQDEVRGSCFSQNCLINGTCKKLIRAINAKVLSQTRVSFYQYIMAALWVPYAECGFTMI